MVWSSRSAEGIAHRCGGFAWPAASVRKPCALGSPSIVWNTNRQGASRYVPPADFAFATRSAPGTHRSVVVPGAGLGLAVSSGRTTVSRMVVHSAPSAANPGSEGESPRPLRSGCRAKNTRLVSALISLVPPAIAWRTVDCSGDSCASGSSNA